MVRLPGVVAAAVLGAFLAQQPTPQPTFRSGIDVVQVDVSVLDERRRPIRGLKAGDFEILVDGVKQPIVGFEEVVMPPRPVPTAAWMRDVAPDVKTNAMGEPRLFLIVMDDMQTPFDPFMVNTGKAVARAIVDELLPSDLAAVVFTKRNDGAQEFTSDRALLLAAIDTFRSGWVPEMGVLAREMSSGVLREALSFLRRRGQGRSAIMLIGVGSGIVEETDVTARSDAAGIVAGSEDQLARDVREMQLADRLGLYDVTNEARLGRVPVYGFSIAGLHVAGTATVNSVAPPGHRRPIFTDRSAVIGGETMHAIATATGGRAITGDNEPARLVPEVFQEGSAYYLIGYRATYQLGDGKTRRLQIRANRQGALVAPSTRLIHSAKQSTRTDAARPAPLLRAITDVVPKSDLRLAVAAAPFAMLGPRSSGGMAAVLAALRVESPAPAERATEHVEALAMVFSPEGKELLTVKQQAAVTLRPAASDAVFDILVPLRLKPGRYNVRYSARSARLDRIGSVYTDVIVPDFGRDRMSVSGVVLTADPMPIAAPREAFAGIVPVVPTTRREFERGDRVRAFMRVYQRTARAETVQITVRITDAADRVVADSPNPLGESVFGPHKAADFSYELPISSLSPGTYLLSIEAKLNPRTTVRRDVRFAVR